MSLNGMYPIRKLPALPIKKSEEKLKITPGRHFAARLLRDPSINRTSGHDVNPNLSNRKSSYSLDIISKYLIRNNALYTMVEQYGIQDLNFAQGNTPTSKQKITIYKTARR